MWMPIHRVSLPPERQLVRPPAAHLLCARVLHIPKVFVRFEGEHVRGPQSPWHFVAGGVHGCYERTPEEVVLLALALAFLRREPLALSFPLLLWWLMLLLIQ